MTTIASYIIFYLALSLERTWSLKSVALLSLGGMTECRVGNCQLPPVVFLIFVFTPCYKDYIYCDGCIIALQMLKTVSVAKTSRD